MSLLANFSILSSGMGLGFPAITFQTLTNQNDPMALTNDQASWFGEFHFMITKILFPFEPCFFCCKMSPFLFL